TRDGLGATGDAHLALIDRAIRESSDPRAGELAVRLAYTLAAAAGTVSPASVTIAVQSAALLRDRALALLDARDLIAEAPASHEDVMKLLEAKRATRAFRVEQPTLTPLSAELQLEAMSAVTSLVRALDTLERATDTNPEADAATASLLDSHFAKRLDELGRA